MPWLVLDLTLGVLAVLVLALVTLSLYRRVRVLMRAAARANEQVATAQAAIEALPRHEDPRRSA